MPKQEQARRAGLPVRPARGGRNAAACAAERAGPPPN
eukprot:CAMPEP_0179334082 /NCGR_PEP_ID=MMETSP0797-20121207/65740_1 /TAXON_ID=47934 /ORGANISM="Dinophysis acuminata, Strain DAEP01" /LENGTH=36 /DNA_ID= /DNA_START= /DNA_END= /DNA_ORIENTATION=